MGRAKLNMELITKEKSRNITFKKRKEGLIRKMHELTTLCDVSACIIIYGPNSADEPEFWPRNSDEVRRIIDIYKAKSKDSGNKTFGLSDFFHDRKRKIEDELNKLRKKNMEAKYPTWFDFLNFNSEAQLRDFAAALGGKAEYVRSRIEFLKRSKLDMQQQQQQQQQHMNMMDLSHPRFHASAYELEVMNNRLHHQSSLNKSHVEMIHGGMDEHQNSMMMAAALLNDHRLQYSDGNIQCASFKRQVYYEAAVEPTPLARYYAPPYVMMPAAVQLPQLQFAARESSHGGGEEDMVEYQRYSA